ALKQKIGQADDAGARSFEFAGNFGQEFALDAAGGFGAVAVRLGLRERAQIKSEALFENAEADNLTARAPGKNGPPQGVNRRIVLEADGVFESQLRAAIEGAAAEIVQALANFGHQIENIAAIDFVPRLMMQIEPANT